MDNTEWNSIVGNFPHSHILQTWEWAQVKKAFGWKPIYKVWQNQGSADVKAAALILIKTLPLRGFSSKLKIMYVPKGPLLSDWSNSALRGEILDDLENISRDNKAIFIKIDPDVVVGTGIPDSEGNVVSELGVALKRELIERRWRFSASQIQYRNTVILDLTKAEDELLARMKQKTRYNIRLSERKGVRVRIGGKDDIAMRRGVKIYDMWGAPDNFNEDDPMWGVFRFKDGFGGKVIRTIGAWDYTSRPTVYSLYSYVIPKILSYLRAKGNRQRSL